jgi:hypothetical protein
MADKIPNPARPHFDVVGPGRLRRRPGLCRSFNAPRNQLCHGPSGDRQHPSVGRHQTTNTPRRRARGGLVDTPTIAGTGSDGHFGAEQQSNTRSRARGSFKSIRRGQNHARGARSATRCDSWARPAIVRHLLPRFGGSDLPAFFGLYRRRRCQLRPRRVRPDPPQYRIGRRGQRCPAGGSPRRAIEHRWRNRSRGAADRVDTRSDRRRQ